MPRWRRSPRAATRRGPAPARGTRRRPRHSAARTGRSRAPATRGSGRSVRQAAASPPPRAHGRPPGAPRSSRSPAACARRCRSSAATRPAGRSCSAARTAIRGARGVIGSSPMCSSTRSQACQSRAMSMPVSPPTPSSDSASASAETRCSVSASGYTAHAIRSAPARVGGERSGQPRPDGALAVEADGQSARLCDALDELRDAVRRERARRVVHDDARRSEVGAACAPARRAPPRSPARPGL